MGVLWQCQCTDNSVYKFNLNGTSSITAYHSLKHSLTANSIVHEGNLTFSMCGHTCCDLCDDRSSHDQSDITMTITMAMLIAVLLVILIIILLSYHW